MFTYYRGRSIPIVNVKKHNLVRKRLSKHDQIYMTYMAVKRTMELNWGRAGVTSNDAARVRSRPVSASMTKRIACQTSILIGVVS